MARIDNETINQIKDNLDIVDVISNYVSLTARGKNYFGVCPFHDDSNPSMSVSREKKIYTCFSCGASGNVIKFIMDFENISFPDALYKCATMANIPIDIQRSQEPPKNKELYSIYDLTSKFYQNNLNSTMGKNAKDYLVNRGITEEIIKEFGIGYSLMKRTLLTDFLLAKGFSKKDLLKSGLVVESENLYDIYHNRIMFPIKNRNGQVIAFSGRIFDSNDTSKYINSKESEIFKKSEILYNLDKAKEYARLAGKIIIMEGFFDVIACYVADIKYAVATMGTAITREHANLIKKAAKEVILCFDGDSAGLKATISCIDELSKVGVEPKIVILEDNLDPDEYLKKYGKEALKNRMENPIGLLDFKLKYRKKNKDLSTSSDMAKYVNEMIEEINSVNDEVEKEIVIKKLSEESKLDVDFIKSKIKKEDKVKEQNIVKEEIKSVYVQAQQHLVYYMLQNKEVIKMYNKNVTYMPDDNLRMLAREINLFYKEYNYIDISEFINYIIESEKLSKTLGEVLKLNLKDNYKIEEIEKMIDTINDYNKKVHVDSLKKKANDTLNTKYLDEIIKLRKGE